MNLRARITAGIGAIIVIGVVVAGYGAFQLHGVSAESDVMTERSGGIIRDLQISQYLEAVRGAENRFRLDGDVVASAEVTENLEAATTLLTTAAKTTASAERRRVYEQMQDALRHHGETFARVTLLTGTAEAALGKLFSGGDALTAATNKLVEVVNASAMVPGNYAEKVKTATLLVRIANWRYLATLDPEGLETFQKNLDKAQSVLAESSGVPDEDVAPVRARLTDYAAAFEAYTAAKAEQMDVADHALRTEITAIQDTLKHITDGLQKDYAVQEAASHALQAATDTNEAVMGAAALLVGGLIAFFISRAIANPIVAMTAAMRRLADQDLAVEIPGADRRDEIGAMAAAVTVFKTNAIAARQAEHDQAEAQRHRAAEDAQVRAEAEAAAAADAATLVVGSIGLGLSRLAAGDLTFRLNTELPAAYETLRRDLNGAMDQLESVVRGIVSNTDALHASTSDISSSADDLSRRTEQQAASLEETAAALNEITTTVRKTADGARHAQEVVATTRRDAETSGGVVQQAVSAMGSIEQSSQQIAQIIGVIDEIAFQTNLLALNAAVEAARAGDAGRGFAVVAFEVRALAQRSAAAAKEIKDLIATSAQHVESGVALVGETGKALTRIVNQVLEITSVVSTIAASAQEQADGLGQVNLAITQMDQVTQQNAAMVEQNNAASHALAQETEELGRLTATFQTRSAAGPDHSPRQPVAAERPRKLSRS